MNLIFETKILYEGKAVEIRQIFRKDGDFRFLDDNGGICSSHKELKGIDKRPNELDIAQFISAIAARSSGVSIDGNSNLSAIIDKELGIKNKTTGVRYLKSRTQ
ncbi:hypothetical protein Tco_1354632 [Tanacetum coccineum]